MGANVATNLVTYSGGVINMPKFKVKILNTSRVIQNLKFCHVTSKIRKFAPLGRTICHVTEVICLIIP